MDKKIIRFTQGFSAAPNWLVFVGPFSLGGAQFFFFIFRVVSNIIVAAILWRCSCLSRSPLTPHEGRWLHNDSYAFATKGNLLNSSKFQKSQYSPRILINFVTSCSVENVRRSSCPFWGGQKIIHISNEFAFIQISLVFLRKTHNFFVHEIYNES